MDINKLTAMADRLSIPQLQQAMRDGSLPAYVGMPLLQQKVQESKQAQAAQAAGKPQAPTVASQVASEADQHEMMKRQALAMQAQMAGTGGISDMLRKPEPEAMAKGGAVAFRYGGDVGDIYEKLANGVPLTDEEKQAINPQARVSDMPEMQALTKKMLGNNIKGVDIPAYAPTNIQDQNIAVQPQTTLRGITPLVPNTTPQTQLSAPAQAAQTLAAEATPQANKPRSNADYVNELKDVLGEGKSNAALKDYLEQQGKDYTESKDKAPWMALMQAGLATMAGTSPFALANIGAGGIQGLKAYTEDVKDLRKEQDKAKELQIKAAQLQDEKDLAIAKFGVESKHSDDIQARQDRNTDKQIASQERIHALDRAVTAGNAANSLALQKQQLEYSEPYMRAQYAQLYTQSQNEKDPVKKALLEQKLKGMEQSHTALSQYAGLNGQKLNNKTAEAIRDDYQNYLKANGLTIQDYPLEKYLNDIRLPQSTIDTVIGSPAGGQYGGNLQDLAKAELIKRGL